MAGGGVDCSERRKRVFAGHSKTMVGVRAGIAVEKGKMFTSDLVVVAALPAATIHAVHNIGFATIRYSLEVM
jgi:hypothetical protein